MVHRTARHLILYTNSYFSYPLTDYAVPLTSRKLQRALNVVSHSVSEHYITANQNVQGGPKK